MVKIVRFRPIFVRNQAKKAANHTDRIVQFTRFEVGLMSAVMLNNEDTNEKKGVQKRQRQREPVRNGEAEIHQRPQTDEGQK